MHPEEHTCLNSTSARKALHWVQDVEGLQLWIVLPPSEPGAKDILGHQLAKNIRHKCMHVNNRTSIST